MVALRGEQLLDHRPELRWSWWDVRGARGFRCLRRSHERGEALRRSVSSERAKRYDRRSTYHNAEAGAVHYLRVEVNTEDFPHEGQLSTCGLPAKVLRPFPGLLVRPIRTSSPPSWRESVGRTCSLP